MGARGAAPAALPPDETGTAAAQRPLGEAGDAVGGKEQGRGAGQPRGIGRRASAMAWNRGALTRVGGLGELGLEGRAREVAAARGARGTRCL
jgi:hypothetical protein